MFKIRLFHLAHIAILFLAAITLPNCIHSFRISPERAINHALDVVEDVNNQFGAALEIVPALRGSQSEVGVDVPESKKGAELQSHVIMTMQEIGINSKGYFDWLLDVDHAYELYPFVYYQKMVDAYVERLVKAQKNLIACKYQENTGRRVRDRIADLEDEISSLIYQLKGLRRFVVSHERYWAEKEKLEKREHNRRELLLKQERNAIEREKLYLEREKQKKKRKSQNVAYNVYDVTVVEYYD